MTIWVTTGADSAGHPWTLVDYSGSSTLLLTQINDGWWFLHTEAVDFRHVVSVHGWPVLGLALRRGEGMIT
ncbi:hypothetical protein [Micromonospora sp. NPDC092111]|uniref:hypothetical protein n=1 Tax=Micromonospora sp. NPDC092111 TaxID=3364289 RepID=UPI0038286F24